MACEPVRSCLTVSGGRAPELGRRSAQAERDSASMSCLPVRLSAPTTTRNQKRNGSCRHRHANAAASGRRGQLEPWDFVFFPSGPAGAHLLRNNIESLARVAMFSSSVATVGAVVYPDTDMVWVWTADDAVDIVVKRSSAVDDAAPWIAGEETARAET